MTSCSTNKSKKASKRMKKSIKPTNAQKMKDGGIMKSVSKKKSY